jgi:hypothetical protein
LFLDPFFSETKVRAPAGGGADVCFAGCDVVFFLRNKGPVPGAGWAVAGGRGRCLYLRKCARVFLGKTEVGPLAGSGADVCFEGCDVVLFFGNKGPVPGAGWAVAGGRWGRCLYLRKYVDLLGKTKVGPLAGGWADVCFEGCDVVVFFGNKGPVPGAVGAGCRGRGACLYLRKYVDLLGKTKVGPTVPWRAGPAGGQVDVGFSRCVAILFPDFKVQSPGGPGCGPGCRRILAQVFWLVKFGSGCVGEGEGRSAEGRHGGRDAGWAGRVPTVMDSPGRWVSMPGQVLRSCRQCRSGGGRRGRDVACAGRREGQSPRSGSGSRTVSCEGMPAPSAGCELDLTAWFCDFR